MAEYYGYVVRLNKNKYLNKERDTWLVLGDPNLSFLHTKDIIGHLESTQIRASKNIILLGGVGQEGRVGRLSGELINIVLGQPPTSISEINSWSPGKFKIDWGKFAEAITMVKVLLRQCSVKELKTIWGLAGLGPLIPSIIDRTPSRLAEDITYKAAFNESKFAALKQILDDNFEKLMYNLSDEFIGKLQVHLARQGYRVDGNYANSSEVLLNIYERVHSGLLVQDIKTIYKLEGLQTNFFMGDN